MSFGGFGAPAQTGSGFSFGGFGSTTQSSAATTTPFAFGSTSSPFSLNQPTTQPTNQTNIQQQPAFGQQQSFGASNPFGASPFGAPNTGSSPFSFSAPNTQSITAQPSHNQSNNQSLADLEQQLMTFKQAYDPQSVNNQFQTIFYNRVEQSKLKSYVQPPHVSAALWQRGLNDNPAPERLVPVVAVGFGDLKKRLEAQNSAASVYQSSVAELSRACNSLVHSHAALTVPALQALANNQARLSSRLLQSINRIELYAQRGRPLNAEEIALRHKLEAIAIKLQRVGAPSERVRELQVRAASYHNQSINQSLNQSNSEQISNQDREKLKSVVQQQTQALEYLMNVVKQDKQELQSIAQDQKGKHMMMA